MTISEVSISSGNVFGIFSKVDFRVNIIRISGCIRQGQEVCYIDDFSHVFDLLIDNVSKRDLL